MHLTYQTFHPLAGHKRVPPHIRICGLMQTPQRHHTGKAQHGVVNAAVAVSLSGGTFVKELSGTIYPGCPEFAFNSNKGQPMQSMGSPEYIEFLKEAWRHMRRRPSFRARASHALWVHDRSSVHQSKVVQDWLKLKGIPSMLTPPRSPDLMPLDYAVLGSVKQKLGKEQLSTAKWAERAKRFLALLRQPLSQRVISSFRERLQACVRADGGHLDLALRKRGGR